MRRPNMVTTCSINQTGTTLYSRCLTQHVQHERCAGALVIGPGNSEEQPWKIRFLGPTEYEYEFQGDRVSYRVNWVQS